MNLLEIYNMIAGLVYGDIASSVPAVGDQNKIRTLIMARHKDCQVGYNFWFQKVITTFPIVTGTVLYDFPDDMKEIISFDLDYELTATGFKLSSTPTEDRDVDLVYWSTIQIPTVWADAYTDLITQYLKWYLIYRVTGDLFLNRSSQTEAQFYYQLADEALFKIEQEDYQRRQASGVIF